MSPHSADVQSLLFYDRTGQWWGATTVSERDRTRAATIDSVGPGPLQVLELGAGFGGAAAATADLGHSVVAIERSRVRAAFARRQIWVDRSGELQVLEADFMEVELRQSFNVVAYWSGFGVAGDDTQLKLLLRIAHWLRPHARAFIDVFDPRWWSTAHGSTRDMSRFVQCLRFDAKSSRCSISYWRRHDPTSTITETIRCYSPDEFAAMAWQAGLVPVGNIEVKREHALSYLVELERRV
ncbi:methyltransferase domain-containing protein [Trinickia sp. LjRoot230]|uniref:methyltransferase domain-containing protein n=1 Tax=Trinickia sp. LjRoot230 TaxID=3342288 RepID=UPI003ECFBF56